MGIYNVKVTVEIMVSAPNKVAAKDIAGDKVGEQMGRMGWCHVSEVRVVNEAEGQ